MSFAGSTSVEIAREANLRAQTSEADEKIDKPKSSADSEKSSGKGPKPKEHSIQITAERYSRPTVSRRS